MRSKNFIILLLWGEQMDIINLKQIISDQKQFSFPQKNIVYRDSFAIDKTLLSNSLINIVTGVRRSGKSVFLQYLRQQLPQNDNFLNFEDDRLAVFTVEDFQTLFLAFLELYGEQPYFFFDEIQNIPSWESFIRRLHDYRKKIFITGSNANMLSRELGAKLTGRYLAYEIYPCSFYEFLQFKNVAVDLKDFGTKNIASMRQLFQEYCHFGGLPEYYSIQTQDYLHTLYENIIYRDIISRYNITNESIIKKLVYYLASNIAKDTNFSALAKLLSVGSSSTIAEYCHYLENSYLCFFLSIDLIILSKNNMVIIKKFISLILPWHGRLVLGLQKIMEECWKILYF